MPQARVRVREPSGGSSGVLDQHRLAAFYVVTFAWSWGYWWADVANGGHWSHTPGLLGPLVGAATVTACTAGRSGLRDLGSRMVRWRVAPRWYGWACLPLLVGLVTAAAVALGPSGFPSFRDWTTMAGFPASGLAVLPWILVVNAFGEETGWRGYALGRFREHHDPRTASFLVALPWALWHLPTFFIDSGYRGFAPVMVPGLVIGLMAGSVVLTWLYEGTGASILLAALWHLCLNLASATTAGARAPGFVVTAFVIVWAIRVIRRWVAEGAGPAEVP